MNEVKVRKEQSLFLGLFPFILGESDESFLVFFFEGREVEGLYLVIIRTYS